jgi:DNA mismatch repair protein MutL
MKIAAGEVIEGPFSVVRELIDNAIDAGSTQIRVAISNGGRDFIQVTDNGAGMSEQDAVLSVRKHTTSKIESMDDLSSITSMGFRGEALSSICAVSDFTMLTMEGNRGIRLCAAYGGDARAEPAAANPGTCVTVRNLFQNLPARKKFLKSNRSEAAKIRDEVVKKAIAFHRCGFSLRSDDRVLFTLQPRDSLADRLRDLFGDAFADNVIEISFDDASLSLHGYISNSSSTRPNRSGQYLFINNRPVTDRSLLYALNSPCRGIVQAGRYIQAFVFIRIDPHYLDINVHPAKKEVKITAADKLYSAVYHSVEEALQRDYYGVSRGGDRAGVLQNKSQPRSVDAKKEEQGTGIMAGEYDGERASVLRESVPDEYPKAGQYSEEAGRGLSLGFFGTTEPAMKPVVDADIHGEKLQYRGSIFNTFLIFEHGNEVVIMDQHAAHERVFYERFTGMYGKGAAVKTLLVPINFTPPAESVEDLLDVIDILKDAGIEIEPFGDESFNILTLPAFIPENREEAVLSQLFDEFYAGKLAFTVEQIRDSFVKLAACRSAVKEGDSLSPDEAMALAHDLIQTQIPFVCPHGRPTMVVYGREYFDKQFRRK